MSVFKRWKRPAQGSERVHFVVSHFDAYQDGALAETETAVYEQHLLICVECREWVRRQEFLLARLEREMAPAAVLAPDSAARIQQNLYHSMRRAVIMNNIRVSVAAMGALAVLALVVGAVAWWQSSGFGAGVEAPTFGERPALTLSGQSELDERVIQAIGQSDTAALAAALEEGADPNAESSPGRQALYLAVRRGDAEVVRLLIDAGADIHADTIDGPFLLRAAHEGQREIVEMLLDAGEDINATGNLLVGTQDNTALMTAANRGHLDVVELLVERGADVNHLNSHGESALLSAAFEAHPEIVRLLLENGADIDHQSTIPYDFWAAGSSALHLAAYGGYGTPENRLEVARILIEHGAALDLEDEDGRTPLDIAGPESEIGRLLREAGAQHGGAQGSAESGLSAFQGPAYIVPGGGRLVRVAGNGVRDNSGNGGPATEASLFMPYGLAWDAEGNLYIGQDYLISKVDAASGEMTTVAGTGLPGYSGNGGPATDAQLGRVKELAFDKQGNLYFADYGRHSIRRIDTNGVITTVVGTGESGFSPDGTLATGAKLNAPYGVAFDPNGTLYFSEGTNHRVRIVEADGTIKTVVGSGEFGESGDGGPAIMAKLAFPAGLSFDDQGNLFIGTTGGRAIRKVDKNGVITTLSGAEPGELVYPDAEGRLYISTWAINISRWTADGTSIILLESGDFDPDGANSEDEQSTVRIQPGGLGLDSAGNIYVTDDRRSYSVYQLELE